MAGPARGPEKLSGGLQGAFSFSGGGSALRSQSLVNVPVKAFESTLMAFAAPLPYPFHHHRERGWGSRASLHVISRPTRDRQ